jgi:hypothetical protein
MAKDLSLQLQYCQPKLRPWSTIDWSLFPDLSIRQYLRSKQSRALEGLISIYTKYTKIEGLAAAALLAAFISSADRSFRSAFFANWEEALQPSPLARVIRFLARLPLPSSSLKKACWKDGRMEKKRKRSIGF